MIQSLLIANRGEIACRIIRTARAMGIRTVAVYSDADAKALHVRQADEAVHIGPSPARESYLVGAKIIAAAKTSGAEAIHPGYGFLSENAEFAQSVIDAGLIWVGPKPASITAMGLKDAAKKLMLAAEVPCTPGYLGENQDPATLADEAARISYPVLIKAVAGGGGKGMRLVEKAEDFADALASCKREASSSFGNAHVLIEKYVLSPRHIEVQVFGDAHGNVVHLFERDCSLQRRHQKVIEEAPAPGMDAATREAVCAAAVRAAKAVDYEGAGTIEFIADASEGLRADRIWFMEMNTRLQVEHPVTEEITGQDLVEWQLRVASGEPLPKKQEELSINGWAMEARLYAEDPGTGFLPSIGRLDHFNLQTRQPVHYTGLGFSSDAAAKSQVPHQMWGNVRVDTGVEEGGEVSTFYDPMIAKIIVRAETREEAIMDLRAQCRTTDVWPVKTNAGFLARLLEAPAFARGGVDTNFIAANLDHLTVKPPLTEDGLDAAAQLVVGEPAGPALLLDRSGFRLNAASQTEFPIVVDGARIVVEMPKQSHPAANCWARAHLAKSGIIKFDAGYAYEIGQWEQRGDGQAGAHDGEILSPMPGKIIAVEVSQGQTVTKGQKLLTLEAMKMEHTLTAPFDGVVAQLSATPGAQVQVEAVLARIEAAD